MNMDNTNSMAIMNSIDKINTEINLLDMAELTETMSIADNVDIHLVSQSDWLDSLNSDNNEG